MPRSSASERERGQVQPLPALVAVLALTVALTAYGGVTHSLPDPRSPSPAPPALQRIQVDATKGAVLRPAALDPAAARLPDYRANVTLDLPDARYARGPEPPASTTAARASVAAASDGDRVVPGVLRVEVWPWPAA